METRELEVLVREETGKGPAHRLRAASRIPAVFYGPHRKQAKKLAVDELALSKAAPRGSNVLLTFRSQGDNDLDGLTAMVKARQFHPVTGKPVHVDFLEIRMDEEVSIMVPVVLTGKAKGIVDGGIVDQVRREIEVRCLPTRIPEKIEVDITDLGIGASIHMSEINLPEGVKSASQVNFTIVAVVAPAAEEVVAAPVPVEGAAPLEGAAPAEGAAPVEGAAPADGAASAAAPADAAAKAGKEKGKARR